MARLSLGPDLVITDRRTHETLMLPLSVRLGSPNPELRHALRIRSAGYGFMTPSIVMLRPNFVASSAATAPASNEVGAPW
jgi:hypothetical protein